MERQGKGQAKEQYGDERRSQKDERGEISKGLYPQLTYIRVSNNLEWNKKRFGIQKMKAAA